MTLRRRWTASIGTWVLLMVATVPAVAREGIVTTKDGQTIRGDVTETDTGVSINSHGVVINVLRDSITSVEYPESIEKQYQDRLDALAGDDAAGRLELARWAYDNGQYKLARDAAQAALDIDPNSTEAVTMLNTVRGQMRLEQSRAEQQPPQQDEPPATGEMSDGEPVGGRQGAGQRIERRLLTADDINRIRQRELRESDNQVRVRFDNDVERRFSSATNQDPSLFRNLRPVQRAVRIMDDGNTDFLQDVRVLSDPQAMMEYRRTVQPLVLNGCATSGCHGGVHGAGLILFSPADNDALTYTNFYILQQYIQSPAQTDAVFGSGEKRMIDRSNPGESLLLQYGLPVDVARVDHPPVRGWRPIFRNMQDSRYRQVVEWIDASLNPVQPDYGIEYTPPTAAEAAEQTGATEPTAPQAEEPVATEQEQPEPADDAQDEDQE